MSSDKSKIRQRDLIGAAGVITTLQIMPDEFSKMDEKETNGTMPVVEMFGPTINGEGHTVGIPTYFVRFGGCDFSCRWCDSLHAVIKKEHGHKWTKYTVGGLIDEILKMSNYVPALITLTGGNPAIHKSIGSVITRMKRLGYTFNLETQGSLWQDWFEHLDYLTVSPKPPSSGMRSTVNTTRVCIDKAGEGTKSIIKIVILNEEDYDFAKSFIQHYLDIPLYLSICNDNPSHESANHQYGSGQFSLNSIKERTEWLINRVASDQYWNDIGVSPVILPQLHTLLWGNDKGV